MQNASLASHDLSALVSTRRTAALGYAIVIAFVVVFLGWGGTIPLTKAAIAPGVVGVEGQKKAVQHLGGGVVAEIHVRDGDLVTLGQPLLTLERADIETRVLELTRQQLDLAAEQARWQAEIHAQLPIDASSSAQPGIAQLVVARSGNTLADIAQAEDVAPSSIDFPEWLVSHAQSSLATQAMRSQQAILQARQSVFEQSMNSLAHQLAQTEEESRSAETRLGNLEAKHRLIDAELAEQRNLERSGLVTRTQVFELEKELADLVLDRDEARSLIEVSAQKQAQIRSEVETLRRTRRQEAAERSTALRNQLSSANQELAVARSELARTQVLAPATGFILNSQVNTRGGVVASGQTLMEIMPRDERLLIESRVDAGDRDSVQVGQSAQVRLTALSRRSTLPLDGIVTLISADRTVDPTTQQVYYTTMVELVGEPSEVLSGVEIHPGMQADVLIVTGEQTLLQYVMSPILRSFDRALREQ